MIASRPAGTEGDLALPNNRMFLRVSDGTLTTLCHLHHLGRGKSACCVSYGQRSYAAIYLHFLRPHLTRPPLLMLKSIFRRNPNSHRILLPSTSRHLLIPLKDILLTPRIRNATPLIRVQHIIQLKPPTLPRPRRNKRLRLSGLRPCCIVAIAVVVRVLGVLAMRGAQPARVAEERFDAG